MGFLGFGNYENAGSGVSKNGPKKRPFFRFIDIYSSRFWKLCGLNFLYFICCVPIVTIGPATAGFTYVLRAFSQDRYADFVSDFFRVFKRDFKKSFLVGIVDVLLFTLIGFALVFYYYNAMSVNKIYYFPFVIMLSMSFMIVIMHHYLYIMLVVSNLKIKQMIKNSILLAYYEIKVNLITFIINFVVVAIILLVALTTPISVWPFILLFIMLIPLSFMGLVICFNSYPPIKKYVIDPYYKELGQENPEDAEMNTEGQAVFKDRGGEEAPVKISNSKNSRNNAPKVKGKKIK